MSHLLQETLLTLQSNNRSPENVLWCGNSDVWFSWEHFKKIADFDYTTNGKPAIAEDLQIVGRDFIMTRCYNGEEEEWWFMEVLPKRPPTQIKPKSLIGKIQ